MKNSENQTCEYCAYFHRHYTQHSDMQFYPISDGHCSCSRLKMRKVSQRACEHFKPKEAPQYEERVFNIRCSVMLPRQGG